MSLDPTDTWSARDRLGLAQHRELIAARAEPGEPGTAAKAIAPGAGGDDEFFGEDGFGFDDFLDMINPLQHVPVLSSVYRELTGDELSTGSRIFGGALFGGPIGLTAAIMNSALEDISGKDIGELVFSIFESDNAISSGQQTATSIPKDESTLGSQAAPGIPFRDSWTSAAPHSAPLSNERSAPPPRMPALSEEEFNLLMTSVGLAPEASAPQSTEIRPRNESSPTSDPHSASSFPPSKVHSAPIDPPGINRSDPDWIANAMQHALEKYDASRGKQGGRGEKLDSDV